MSRPSAPRQARDADGCRVRNSGRGASPGRPSPPGGPVRETRCSAPNGACCRRSAAPRKRAPDRRAAHCSTCMPPIDPPITHNSVSMPSRSSSMACARTMSRNGDERKIQPPGLAGRRIVRGRAGRPHAAADHIRADDEIPVGIERLAGTDHGLPPAGLAGQRMRDWRHAGRRSAHGRREWRWNDRR